MAKKQEQEFALFDRQQCYQPCMSKENHFDASVAETYDRDHGNTDPQVLMRTVEVLADLAEGGRVLEFAIGTGRIALTLAAQGVDVAGIELSPDMVAVMRRKPGGGDIPVIIGDISEAQIDGAFSLVVLVFNTIDNLTSQDAQVACFANAARHLRPGGRFVVETLVPPLQDLPFGQTIRAFAADPDHMGSDTFDVVTQNYVSHHIWPKSEGCQQLSVPFRYAWPAEMDLMARIAGLVTEHRWADWDRQPFTKDARKHISVWRKPLG